MTGEVYYDDVALYDNLPFTPAEFTGDDFEAGFGNWDWTYGTPTTNTSIKFSGNQSYVLNEDTDGISHSFPVPLNKVVELWFYDSGDSSAIVFGRVGTETTNIGLGVNTAKSSKKYTYRVVSGSSIVDTVTLKSRSTGWHRLIWDFTSNTGVNLRIDGEQIATLNDPLQFDRIMIGDFWADSAVSSVYFDNLKILDTVPAEMTGESFENSFGNWIQSKGTPTTSTAQSHSGKSSYLLNEDADQIIYNTGYLKNAVVEMWFYDNAADIALKVLGQVDDVANDDTVNGVGLGVNTSISKTNYVYLGKDAAGSSSYTATGVVRSTGWHQLIWDYRSETGADLYIDGVFVTTVTTSGGFNRIAVGDMWADGLAGTVYFDDIKILDTMPADFKQEDFENDVTHWAYLYGTPGTSTTQKHGGSSSYHTNEVDQSAIAYHFGKAPAKVVETWFYDNPGDVALKTMAMVEDESNDAQKLGIGVNTATSTGYYSFLLGATFYATTIARSDGWHQLIWDYRSGTDVKLYIDQQLILTTRKLTKFNRIILGDIWADKLTGEVYYDDVTLYDNLPFTPAEFTGDDFEAGFGNWDWTSGTPVISDSIKHTAKQSYYLNEDVDGIGHYFPAPQKKIVELWFYDSGDTSVYTMGRVGTESMDVGIGVNTGKSSGKYVYSIRTDSTYQFTITDKTRTKGWHQFLWDFSSETEVKLYIDGSTDSNRIALLSNSNATIPSAFNLIQLGDFWDDNVVGNAYFDDLRILDRLPEEITGDSFENTLKNWAYTGTVGTSSEQKHSGKQSYYVDNDNENITFYTPGPKNKVVDLWFYDDYDPTSATNPKVMAAVDDDSVMMGIGVNKAKSKDKYVYWIAGTADSNCTITSIARSAGWHHFTWDYRSGRDVKMYIDNTIIKSSTQVTAIKRICLGDFWNDTVTSALYFDDVNIYDNLPGGIAEFSGDSFEDGFGNWITSNGTATQSSVQNQYGKYSYRMDQDQDTIKHIMSSNQNKLAVVWFYDNAGDTYMRVMAFVDDESTRIGLGVNTPTSTSKYVYRKGTSYYTTTVTRSSGWHELAWDYRSGSNVELYIDRIKVATLTELTCFNTIAVGDFWEDTTSTVDSEGATTIRSGVNPYYFDNIQILDEFPPEFSGDGFENGFNGWAYRNGIPSASNYQYRNGSLSYKPDEDQDRIAYQFAKKSNKVVECWFFDYNGASPLKTLGEVGLAAAEYGLGVNTDKSKDYYVYWNGTLADTACYVSTKRRFFGWHQLIWDFTSGTDVKLWIDGTIVKTTPCTGFNWVAMGDAWADSRTSNVYFDDLLIEEAIPNISGTISINNDEECTNQTLVNLSLTGSNATYMRFSNDNILWSDWEEFHEAKAKWSLENAADGECFVYAQFKDNLGHISPSYYDIITLDTTQPDEFTVTVTPNGANGWLNVKPEQLDFQAVDATSGIDHYELSFDTEPVQIITSPYIFPASLTEGQHSITITAVDRAGNRRLAATVLGIDTTNPEVKTIDPVNDGFAKKGTTLVMVDASDATSSIRQIEFYIDDTLAGTVGGQDSHITNYSCSLDTGSLEVGSIHTLLIKAYDQAGNVGSATISVKISEPLDINDIQLLPPIR